MSAVALYAQYQQTRDQTERAGGPGHRARALEGGFDAHMAKPVDPGVIDAILGGAAPTSP